MIRNRGLQLLLIPGILIAILYSSYRMLQNSGSPGYRSVSVIVDNSTSDRWIAFREGLEQGALEEQINISFVSTDVFKSTEEETAVIRKELENGADGLIVEPCGDDREGQLLEALPQPSSVLVVFSISSDPLMEAICADWHEMGSAAAETVSKEYPACRVGILAGDLRLGDMDLCLGGARGFLQSSGVEIVWICSPADLPDEFSLEKKLMEEPADVLLALDDSMTKLAADYARGTHSEPPGIIGIGRSEQNIISVDEGWISALIVPDEYYMGYHCVKTLSQKLGTYSAVKETAPVPFVTVTKDNLYNEDTETLLFPIRS